MTAYVYPKTHFTGTPTRGRRWVKNALDRVAVGRPSVARERDDWRVALEAIARYETDWDPTVGLYDGPAVGLMQLARGMYVAAANFFPSLVPAIDLADPVQAVVVAVLYIRSELPGYGGYHGILGLLARTDRGPGEVLRKWSIHPRWDYARLRPYYHGY